METKPLLTLSVSVSHSGESHDFSQHEEELKNIALHAISEAVSEGHTHGVVECNISENKDTDYFMPWHLTHGQ
jgi:hypothetical protein